MAKQSISIQCKQSKFGRLMFAMKIPAYLVAIGIMDIESANRLMFKTYRYRVNNGKWRRNVFPIVEAKDEESSMGCKYKQTCPSYSGWCEGRITDYSRCIPFLITAVENERAKHRVHYLCDHRACDKCRHSDCHHTSDVRHAENFENHHGIFVEKVQTPPAPPTFSEG